MSVSRALFSLRPRPVNNVRESGVAIAETPETKRNFRPHLHSDLRSLTNQNKKPGRDPIVAVLRERGGARLLVNAI